MHEVDSPEMVGMRQPKPDDGTVVMLEPLVSLMALRLLQSFLAPKPLNLLVFHAPAFDPQPFDNPAIAVTLCKADNDQPQVTFFPRYSLKVNLDA